MKRSAFTLVELLVVVAIIGLLSTVAIASMNASRINSRDAKRIADLKQIRLALSMFYNDNGYYPPSPCGYDCNGYYRSNDANWSTFTAVLAPYIGTLPIDPTNTPSCLPWAAGVCYAYAYGNVGRYTNPITYDLSTRLESTTNPQRCGVQDWKWGLGLYGTLQHWCTAFGGSYTDQMYEVAPAD